MGSMWGRGYGERVVVGDSAHPIKCIRLFCSGLRLGYFSVLCFFSLATSPL